MAHEPPLLELLPEGSERRKGNQAIYDTYLKEGAGPAMEMFAAVAGLEEEAPPADLSPEAQEAMAQQMARMEQNIDFFFAHYLMPITTYRPDFGKLQDASARWWWVLAKNLAVSWRTRPRLPWPSAWEQTRWSSLATIWA